ncbi:hypothetical protein [Sporosarcina ureae]|uniref:hypothetical protein n=1 Tax=Sporosarcina ureae TaxID=1571 RepID=UPI0026F20586|nr:hypothetical protein [Sporosarcina ureae]
MVGVAMRQAGALPVWLIATPTTTAEVAPMTAPLTLLVKLLPLHKTRKSKRKDNYLTSYPTY